MKSSSSALSKLPNGHTPPYKEVRFSQFDAPIRRTRSVATSNPLLDPGYSTSRTAIRTSRVTTYSEFAVYVEQSRSLLESQRANLERERAVFVEERKLWDMERALLKSRIAELEFAGKANTRQLNGVVNSEHFKTDFTFQGNGNGHEGSQINGQSNNDGQNGHHVWERPERRPTRVFLDANKKSNLFIPPIAENGFDLPPSLDAALSPQSRAADRTEAVSVPIEKLDSELDGITLKSTALPPDVVAKVMTPLTSISPISSPPKLDPDSLGPGSEGRSPSKLKLSDLGPPDMNLTRHAGHTPMAILGTETNASNLSPSEEIIKEENPLAPAVTKQKQPLENSDTYFPPVEDDPALKGPLMLQNEEETDNSFLSELDQKLLDEAKKAVSGPSPSESDAEADADIGESDKNESDPVLKLKDSTNFGTAFGVSECGKV